MSRGRTKDRNPLSDGWRIAGGIIGRYNKAWRETCKRAGVQDFHFHDLRHTFCTNLILAGADLKNVKEMIGHRDLAMTDRYTHMTGHHKQFWQDKVAEQYENGGRSTANKG